jgi:hypothetical protein
MLMSIVLGTVLVVVTSVIAKILRIGSNEFYRKQTERGQLVGRHCCLSGLADFSEDLRKSRDAA